MMETFFLTDLKVILIVIGFLFTTFLSAVGISTYHGVRIYFLWKNEQGKNKGNKQRQEG